MLSLLTQRLLTGCLILLALGLLVGCAKQQSNVERGNANQELYIGIGTEPSGLDPQLTTGLTEYSVMTALLEGLTTLDAETMQVRPGVAQYWDISKDGLTYTFYFAPTLAGPMAIQSLQQILFFPLSAS